MSLPTPGSPAALQAIGWPPADTAHGAAWREIQRADPGARPARVMAQHRSGYLVAEGPGSALAAESPSEWQRPAGRRHDPLARATVGDWVLLDGSRILSLLPRRNVISRAAASEGYRQQLIAANLDVAFILCGLDGDFNPRRIERYLLLVQGQGLTPVIVLTKADHPGVDAHAARRALSAIRAQGVPLIALNARAPGSARQLAPWLGAGVTAVLLGSSGAGKSTLTNTLSGQARMRTGEVRIRDARGRHTTTHRALIALPTGACLIDTPGMRALKPTGDEPASAGGFADIEALAAHCRFHDCRHQAEPGCAVCAAVADGALDPARLAHYHKLQDALAEVATQRAGRQPGSGRTRRHPPHPAAR